MYLLDLYLHTPQNVGCIQNKRAASEPVRKEGDSMYFWSEAR